MDHRKFYTITNENDMFAECKYKKGLNVAPLNKYNTSLSEYQINTAKNFNFELNLSDQFKYTDKNGIYYFSLFGRYVQEIYIPREVQVTQIPHTEIAMYKSEKIEIGRKFSVCNDGVIREFNLLKGKNPVQILLYINFIRNQTLDFKLVNILDNIMWLYATNKINIFNTDKCEDPNFMINFSNYFKASSKNADTSDLFSADVSKREYIENVNYIISTWYNDNKENLPLDMLLTILIAGDCFKLFKDEFIKINTNSSEFTKLYFHVLKLSISCSRTAFVKFLALEEYEPRNILTNSNCYTLMNISLKYGNRTVIEDIFYICKLIQNDDKIYTNYDPQVVDYIFINPNSDAIYWLDTNYQKIKFQYRNLISIIENGGSQYNANWIIERPYLFDTIDEQKDYNLFKWRTEITRLS